MGTTRTRIRRDGWTAERQLHFLNALAATLCVGKAAAGMSRESAYRLRDRREGALFAALWDCVFAPPPPSTEVHIEELSDGRIMRLLGNHYRRERGDFSRVGLRRTESRGTDRTSTL